MAAGNGNDASRGRLTTHVLDTSLGRPAAGLALSLWRLTGEGRDHLADRVTNADGRTDAPLLEGAAFEEGTYEIAFEAGPYLARSGASGPGFLGTVPVRFAIAEPRHYHVPLLLSPYGYSTYRGS